MGGAVKSVTNVAKKAAGSALSPTSVLGGTTALPFTTAKALSSGAGRQLSIPNVGLSADAMALARMQDIQTGRQFGKDVVGPGSLGRLQGQGNIDQALRMLRSDVHGMSSPEMQAHRDIATSGINRSTELARRRLGAAQARSGVRGATAAKQQSDVIGQGIQATSDFERNLMLGQREMQSRAAKDLLAGQTGVTQFDLGQKAREKFAELSTGLGFAQIGSAERAGRMGANASIAAAQAQRPGGGILGGVLGK